MNEIVQKIVKYKCLSFTFNFDQGGRRIFRQMESMMGDMRGGTERQGGQAQKWGGGADEE